MDQPQLAVMCDECMNIDSYMHPIKPKEDQKSSFYNNFEFMLTMKWWCEKMLPEKAIRKAARLKELGAVKPKLRAVVMEWLANFHNQSKWLEMRTA